MRFVYSLILVGCLTTAGCSSQAQLDAAELALATRRQVVTLKQEIQRKIAAEERFYERSLKTVEDALRRKEYEDLMESVMDGAERDAVNLVKRPADATPIKIAASLSARAETWVKVKDARDSGIEEQLATMGASIDKLNALRDQYTALEKTLTLLSIPSDQRDDIREVAGFISGVAKRIKELDKERREAEAAATQPTGGTP